MASAPHDLGSRRWNAGRVLRWVCIGLAALAAVAAFVIVLLPLPHPAAGGTCGPGHGSEPAIAAFFDPVSIGAGPVPSGATPSGATAVYQWQAFVGQCQASTNARMVDALALLILAGFFVLVVLPFARRAWHEPAAATATHSAAPGWYPDPANPSAWRWWDGNLWAHEPTPARQEPGAAHDWPYRPEATAGWPPGPQQTEHDLEAGDVEAGDVEATDRGAPHAGTAPSGDGSQSRETETQETPAENGAPANEEATTEEAAPEEGRSEEGAQPPAPTA